MEGAKVVEGYPLRRIKKKVEEMRARTQLLQSWENPKARSIFLMKL